MFPPTQEGVRDFLTSPSFLVVALWNKRQREKAESANALSATTAQLTVLIKAIADSFAKQKTFTTMQDFLPFALDTFASEVLSSEAISCYNYYKNLGLIPNHFKRALGANSNLVKQLRG